MADMKSVQEAFEQFKSDIKNSLSACFEKLVPKSRKINNKELRNDITLTYEDVGADKAGSAQAVKNELQDEINELRSDMNDELEDLSKKLGGISIRKVTSLPSSPAADTLYLVIPKEL